MPFSYYKKTEGTTIRVVAAVSLLLIVLYGCYALYSFVPPIDTNYDPPRDTFWGTGWSMPFFDVKITYGLLISFVLFVLIGLLVYLWILNKPKTGDFLIETEGELKKVSWPSRQQYMGSSIAVIVSVVLLGLFLLFADKILQWLLRGLLKLY